MKTDKYLKVSNAVMQIVAKDGLLKLNVSKVSKLSGVSRPWIYQYMGKDRKKLISYSAQICADFFARSHISIELNSIEELKLKLRQGAEFALATCLKNPSLPQIYFKYNGADNWLGHAIQGYQNAWIKKFSKHFVRVLKIDTEAAQSLSKGILLIRLAFSHDAIARSKSNIKFESELETLCDLQERLVRVL